MSSEIKENKEATKPITLLREDLISAIAKAINESKLPAFVVEGVLKDFINEVHIASQRQLEADRKKWEETLTVLNDKQQNIKL